MTIKHPLRVALVVPHVFMGDELREQVIFSPGELAREFANADWGDILASCGVFVGIASEGAKISLTLFTPLPVKCKAPTVVADYSGFERELAGRGYGYLELLKKHPSLFVALSRQLQGEIIASAFARANAGEFDLVHIYTNEEDQALIFADLCRVPVVFTHHDPYNFLIKYKSVFPQYRGRNFVSMSLAQQRTAPEGTNFVANIYHGVRLSAPVANCRPEGTNTGRLAPLLAEQSSANSPRSAFGAMNSHGAKNTTPYFIYVGRIIEPKGVHLAIAAAERAGVNLKIVGKRYDDNYFEREIATHLEGTGGASRKKGGKIEYLGFKRGEALQTLVAGARGLLMPSQFEEPFGMTAIEALAVGTPVIASRNGALPEIIEEGKSGFFADSVDEMAAKMAKIDEIRPENCVKRVKEQFSLEKMLAEHAKLWLKLAKKS
ncbi:MAG: glycosyltransferase [Candidatus Nomurabacteria bacterium]|jgi:glycosyltransferase involved in cell wall biosynthesis|nr:glycosyltransferase [Candidatus Nomurabacteria bacterium]